MNISALGVASLVNSTAVGIASSEIINSSEIECTFGTTMPVSVGNTSLCVTGKSYIIIIVHACLKHAIL